MSNSVRRTSIEVYHRITSEGLLSTKRKQVYDILYEHGNLTGSQVAKIFKSKHPSSEHSESIRNRITELVQQKVVMEHGTIECPITGNTVLLFGTTDSLPEKIPTKETKKQRIEGALTMMEVFGNTLPSEALKIELRKIYKVVRDI